MDNPNTEIDYGKSKNTSLDLVELEATKKADMTEMEKRSEISYISAMVKFVAIKTTVDSIIVNDAPSLINASDFLKKIKEWIKGLEEKRKDRVKPLKDYIKVVEGDYKPFEILGNEAKDIISQKIINYQSEQEKIQRIEAQKKRDEELAQLKKVQEDMEAIALKADSEVVIDKAIEVEARIQKIEARPIEIKQTVRSDNSTTSIRKYWTYECENDDLVDRKYCSHDPAKVRAAIKEGVREIKGLRIFEASTVLSR